MAHITRPPSRPDRPRPPAPRRVLAGLSTGVDESAPDGPDTPDGATADLADTLDPAAERLRARHAAAPPPSSTPPPASGCTARAPTTRHDARLHHQDRHRRRRALRPRPRTTASPRRSRRHRTPAGHRSSAAATPRSPPTRRRLARAWPCRRPRTRCATAASAPSGSRYDTSRYSGPALHPIGPNENIAPVSALMVDEGAARRLRTAAPPRAAATRPATRPAPSPDCCDDARHQTPASGPAPGRPAAKSRAGRRAPLRPLSALVERMLTNSDNDIAEALARQTALAAGEPADFDGGRRAVTAQLKKLRSAAERRTASPTAAD